MSSRFVAIDEGADITLDRAMVVVGRHPDCDTRLNSLRVMRPDLPPRPRAGTTPRTTSQSRRVVLGLGGGIGTATAVPQCTRSRPTSGWPDTSS
jgi:hypothetical protein